MKIPTLEAALFAVVAGAVGCDDPEKVAPDTAAISTTVSRDASTALSPAIAMTPSVQTKSDPSCPTVANVQHMCGKEVPTIILESIQDPNFRSKDCDKIRAGMRDRLDDYLNCSGAIQKFSQCSGASANDKEAVIAERDQAKGKLLATHATVLGFERLGCNPTDVPAEDGKPAVNSGALVKKIKRITGTSGGVVEAPQKPARPIRRPQRDTLFEPATP